MVDSAAGGTVALLRAEELGDLQKRYGTRNGGLVLRRGHALMLLRWEERRLLRAILRGGDDELPIRVEEPSPPPRSLPTGPAGYDP